MRRPTGEWELGLLWLSVALLQGVVGGGAGEQEMRLAGDI